MIVYSIGHSNTEIEELSGLLAKHGIEILIDTRSAPYSRYSPQFNKEALQRRLAKEDIEYVYMGDRLGGRPRGEQFYLVGGKVDYDLLAQERFYLDGVDEMLEIAAKRPLAFMCSEADFRNCHRYKLITRTLVGRGVAVRHIMHSGELVESSAEEFEPEQPSLF